jgi:hypothetical protein
MSAFINYAFRFAYDHQQNSSAAPPVALFATNAFVVCVSPYCVRDMSHVHTLLLKVLIQYSRGVVGLATQLSVTNRAPPGRSASSGRAYPAAAAIGFFGSALCESASA